MPRTVKTTSLSSSAAVRGLLLIAIGFTMIMIGIEGPAFGLPNLAGTTLVAPTLSIVSINSPASCPAGFTNIGQGCQAQVTGTGYSESNSANVYLQLGNGIAQIIAAPISNPSGAWSIDVGFAPSQPIGVYTIWGVDVVTGSSSDKTQFMVQPLTQVQAQVTTTSSSTSSSSTVMTSSTSSVTSSTTSQTSTVTAVTTFSSGTSSMVSTATYTVTQATQSTFAGFASLNSTSLLFIFFGIGLCTLGGEQAVVGAMKRK